jgi:hypothetical protein
MFITQHSNQKEIVVAVVAIKKEVVVTKNKVIGIKIFLILKNKEVNFQ